MAIIEKCFQEPPMSMPLTRVQLLIDETEVDLGNIWVHRQGEPHPGGHRYRVWLPAAFTAKWPAKVEPDLMQLDCLLSCWRQEQGIRIAGPALFVLNTIDKITETGQGVEGEGECSPHCSTLKCPCCSSTVWANWLFDHCVRGEGGSLLFTCRDCSGVSKVTVENEVVALSSLDGNRKSECRQVALGHQRLDGNLRITLGKLRWDL